MIVIKTDMKELPKKCIRCEIHTSIFNGTDIGKNYCLNKRLTEDNMLNTRPEWCPLIITNRKWLESLSDDEFAEVLSLIAQYGNDLSISDIFVAHLTQKKKLSEYEAEYKDWLKKEHKESK